MTDIPQEWIDAGAVALATGAEPGYMDEFDVETVLAAVLPLIADKVRENRHPVDWRNEDYIDGWRHGREESADLIWPRPVKPRRRKDTP